MSQDLFFSIVEISNGQEERTRSRRGSRQEEDDEDRDKDGHRALNDHEPLPAPELCISFSER